ncbi:TNFAIP3 [Branchiostoma lanceolatum]|uniref:ubiquitinyl hydrolase 1 n=1 Tax=Branchiostoma lanceolatum TaxID=7740 RepID=A0A8J9YIA6_BRALA|nr:TNFAIP3 [Branchiostoma lanceolatum]
MVTMTTPEPTNPVNGQHCYRSLEEFHVFTLANVLRRPIIIIADPVYRNVEGHSLAPVHFGGIYLPLLWRPQHCVRYPIVLAFHNQHFTPLIAEEVVPAPNGPASSQSMPPAQQQAFPLTARDLRLFQVQYLQPREENRVMELLHQYLHIVEVPLGDDDRNSVPAALIDGPPVPAELNFITDLLQYDWSGQRVRESWAPEAEATGSQCSQGAEGLSVSVSSALPTTPAQQTQPTMQSPPPVSTLPTQPPGTQQCVYKGCNRGAQEQYGFLCQQHHQKFYEDKARYSRANSEQSIQGIKLHLPVVEGVQAKLPVNPRAHKVLKMVKDSHLLEPHLLERTRPASMVNQGFQPTGISVGPAMTFVD